MRAIEAKLKEAYGRTLIPGQFTEEDRQAECDRLTEKLRKIVEEERQLRREALERDLERMTNNEALSTLRRMKRGAQKNAQAPMTVEALDGIAAVYEKQFQPCSLDAEDGECPQQLDPSETYVEHDQGDPIDAPLTDQITESLSVRRVGRLLVKAANGKAPGADGINKERLALPAGEVDVETLIRHPAVVLISLMFQVFMKIGTTPSGWTYCGGVQKERRPQSLVQLETNCTPGSDEEDLRKVLIQIYHRKWISCYARRIQRVSEHTGSSTDTGPIWKDHEKT